MNNSTLDEMDLKILRCLQDDAKMTTRQIAAKVNRSTTPVFERIRRLENEGFIKKYTAVLDPDKMGRGLMVFCSVKLKQMNRDIAKDFVSVIRNIPEVAACYNVAGEFDYILTIYAPDMKYYNDFIINVLGTVESIGSILSTFVMKEIKQGYGIFV